MIASSSAEAKATKPFNSAGMSTSRINIVFSFGYEHDAYTAQQLV